VIKPAARIEQQSAAVHTRSLGCPHRGNSNEIGVGDGRSDRNLTRDTGAGLLVGVGHSNAAQFVTRGSQAENRGIQRGGDHCGDKRCNEKYLGTEYDYVGQMG